MRKVFQKQEGFTLIELMIVVAIIGILAAIAIPNFLQYQMKGRQSEAKTNLMAIKTSQVSFQGDQGCYLGMAPEGNVAPAAGVKTVSALWGLGLPATPPPVAWCAGGIVTGFFNDIGFRATGQTNYRYSVNAVALPPGPTQLFTPAGGGGSTPSCPLVIAGAGGVGAAASNNFFASAQANLDGDSVGPTTGISSWGSTLDHGAWDCTTGVY